MRTTNITELERFKNKSYLLYSNPQNNKTFKLTEYRYKGLKLISKLPSKNQLRKAKRYDKTEHKPTFLNMANSTFNKKPQFKKQQEHFKITLNNQKVVFNNGYMKNLNLSKDGNLKISSLFDKIINQ